MSPRRRRLFGFAILIVGALVTFWLTQAGPQTQHVRLILGARAADVRGLDVAYVDAAGDEARRSRLAWDQGAPRVVSQEPELIDGEYVLRIDLDTTRGRRAVERRVKLRGDGTTSVDLVVALAEHEKDAAP